MFAYKKTLLAAAAVWLSAGAAASETVVSPQLPVQMVQLAMPPMVQMVPAAGAQALYWVAPPGMAWPAVPAYPAPMMPPPNAWRPFVWMLVPVLPAAPAAEVSYGPVADTPVVLLPPPEPAQDPAPAVAAVPTEPPASAAVESEPARLGDVPVETPPALALPGPALPDYGPVAPTPVVDVLALQQPAAAVRPRTPHRNASKAARPPAPAVASPAAAGKPARQRMCWSNGVVAPCR